VIAGLLDEVADQATVLLRNGQARTPEEATDLAIQIYCSGGRCSSRGLDGFFSDAWDVLVGKPQSWYTNVSNIQNQLSVLLAGVTAVGGDIWNSTADGVSDYGQVTGDIQAAISSIIVTKSHVPDDATIANARSVANTYQGQLSLIQSALPDVSAQVQADQAQVQSMLPTAMTSPSAAGQAEFEKVLDERASAFGQGLGDIAKYLAYAAGGILGIYALSKMGGSRAA
jgi:hypothetical protein